MSIKRYPTICFVLISFNILLAGCSHTLVQGGHLEMSDDVKLIANMTTFGTSAVKLRTVISFEKAQLSGITLFKIKGDSVVGAFFNEFGMTGFEFVAWRNHCHITQMLPQMDKWYIRKTISEDMAFIFTIALPSNLNDSTTHWQSANRSLKYNYRMNKPGKIIKIDRMHDSEITGELTFTRDSLIVLQNLKRNISYTMSLMTLQK